MSKKTKKGQKGCGLGPHHAVSPMGHGTRTPSKLGKQGKADRKAKQQGWR